MMAATERHNPPAARPPIELSAGGAFMRLYPGSDVRVEVSRTVALHIFALVCRYNQAQGRSWSRFWRHLTQAERDMTVLFVQANGRWDAPLPPEGMLGTTMWLSGLVEDFRAIAAGGRRPRLPVGVEQELVALYEVFVRATVTPDDVRAAWAAEFPEIYALLDRTGALQVLMTDGRYCASEQVAALVEGVLFDHGEAAVQQIQGWTHADRCRNDARLVAGRARRLASGAL